MKLLNSVICLATVVTMPVCAEDWQTYTRGNSRFISSTYQDIGDGSATLKVTLERNGQRESTLIGCSVNLAVVVQRPHRDFSELANSISERCDVSTSMGTQGFSCHVHSVPNRMSQTVTLKNSESNQQFIVDSLMFANEISLIGQAFSSVSIDMEGLRSEMRDSLSWCDI